MQKLERRRKPPTTVATSRRNPNAATTERCPTKNLMCCLKNPLKSLELMSSVHFLKKYRSNVQCIIRQSTESQVAERCDQVPNKTYMWHSALGVACQKGWRRRSSTALQRCPCCERLIGRGVQKQKESAKIKK